MNKVDLANRRARLRNSYELPETLTIKIRTKGLDQDLLDALRCLLVNDREELPFELARYMLWPNHQRAIAARAQILLRNGYLDLVEKSRQPDDGDEKTEQPPLELSDGFPNRPRVQI